MELGGHAPAIVFDDADVEPPAKTWSPAKYRNAGQVCVSPTRFLVQEKVYDEFVERVRRRREGAQGRQRAGAKARHGPAGQCAPHHRDGRLHRRRRRRRAPRSQTGGNRIGNKGNFFEPTVLTDVPRDARVMNEEPFGPLAMISPFSDFDDAVAEANRLPLRAGVLCLYAFGEDRERDRPRRSRRA